MSMYTNTSHKNQSTSVQGTSVVKNAGNKTAFSVADNRSEALSQRRLKDLAAESCLDCRTAQLQGLAYRHAQVSGESTVFPVSRKTKEEDAGEASMAGLSDEEARQHAADNFKRGGLKAPLMNKSGALAQLLPKKESYKGGDLFSVVKADLGTGTATSEGTRKYVNDDNTPKPSAIKFDYATAKNTKKGVQEVKGNDDAYEVDNPEADKAYKSGKLWDAGHKLGKQNGGLGNDNDWVFPQNPAFNQGNSKNMLDVDSEETRPAWREHEDAFREGVEEDGAGSWWIGFM